MVTVQDEPSSAKLVSRGRSRPMRTTCPSRDGEIAAARIVWVPSLVSAARSILAAESNTSQSVSARRKTAAGVGAANGKVSLRFSPWRRSPTTTGPSGLPGWSISARGLSGGAVVAAGCSAGGASMGWGAGAATDGGVARVGTGAGGAAGGAAGAACAIGAALAGTVSGGFMAASPSGASRARGAGLAGGISSLRFLPSIGMTSKT